MGPQAVQIAAVVALLATGCAHRAGNKVAASLWHAGGAPQLLEDGESLISADVRLGWSGAGWRGVAWGDTVELEATGNGITGFAAGSPVNLTVELSDDTTVVQGLFDHQLGVLRVSASHIEGRIGRCAYDVRSDNGTTYEGFRTCRDGLVRTRLALKSLGGHPLGAGRIAPLLVLLAR